MVSRCQVDTVSANQFPVWTVEHANRKRTYMITGGHHPTKWEHEGQLKSAAQAAQAHTQVGNTSLN